MRSTNVWKSVVEKLIIWEVEMLCVWGNGRKQHTECHWCGDLQRQACKKWGKKVVG